MTANSASVKTRQVSRFEGNVSVKVILKKLMGFFAACGGLVVGSVTSQELEKSVAPSVENLIVRCRSSPFVIE